MTVDELSVVMADIVVDKSDLLNVNFNKIFKNLPDEKYFRRELMYFKAFLVSFRAFVVSNSSNEDEAYVASKLMLKKLGNYFDSNDYGCNPNYSELVSAFDHYWQHVDIMIKRSSVPPSRLKGPHLEYELSFYIDTAVQAKNFFRFLKDSYFYSSVYVADSRLFHTSFLKTYQQIKDILEAKTSSNNGSCFVATATYQDTMHPNVILLRDYRDRFLRKTLLGRMFIWFYYKVGPYFAFFPEHFSCIRKFSKSVIDKIVLRIKKKYY